MTPTWIEKIRHKPLAYRQTLAVGLIIGAAIILLIIWFATGFGLSTKGGDLETIKKGVGSVSSLIESQTDQYQKNKTELEDNLNTVLKTSALVIPPSLVDLQEEPDGVLFLNYDYRQKGSLVRVEQIEFYPSTAIVSAKVTNESSTTIHFDASLGSAIIQTLPSGSRISYQPLFQSGSPTPLEPGQESEIIILFGPVNGRQEFKLAVGDFLSDLDPDKAERWGAEYSIDPSKIIKQTKQNNSPKP